MSPQLEDLDQDLVSPDDWELERGRLDRLTRDERRREGGELLGPHVPLW